jgi:uncharacterized protein YodC (DUF2158 family)
MELKVGDVVELKSGGPKMTITRIDSDSAQFIWCRWFSADNKVNAQQFPPAALQKVT